MHIDNLLISNIDKIQLNEIQIFIYFFLILKHLVFKNLLS